MKQVGITASLVALFACTIISYPTHALGLKIAPLEYKTVLNENEVKNGIIDISNPSSQAVSVRSSVQAFKQINNDGGLQFYDDARVESAVKVDLTDFELGPREAVRVAFKLDGKDLPDGDVYAAIFFTTEPKQPRNGVGQSVRVGTILSIVNKTPGSRAAAVTGLSLPILQLGDTAKGTYSIRNTGPSGGFYPTVLVSAWPAGKPRQVESSLVFSGRERTNDVAFKTGLGIHRVEVAYGDSKKSQWVIAIEPWMIAVGLLVIFILTIELMLLRRRRKT